MTDEAAAPNLGDGLGIDVATAELDDDELTRVLEALLLVVDTPVSAQTLATVTEQPVYRITDKLQHMAAEFTARDSGMDLREAGGATRARGSARVWNGWCWTVLGPSSPARRWRHSR